MTISNRLEHTAVLSSYGNMFVWGGRFQGTSDISGMWSLNVAGKESTLLYIVANDDNVYNETVAALYVLVTTVMLVSMMFTYMCGVLTRQSVDFDEGAIQDFNLENAAPTSFFGRRSGLGQDIIEMLPTKTYHNTNDPDTDVNQNAPVTREQGESSNPPSTTSSNELSFDFDDEGDCCPICLVEYTDGDELRALPCKHEFHKCCVDPWLGNNASCPACRHSLRDLVNLTTNASTAALSWGRNSTNVPSEETANNQGGASEVDNTQNETRSRLSFLPGMTITTFLHSISSSNRAVQPPGSRRTNNRSRRSRVPVSEDDLNDLELSYSSSLENSDEGDAEAGSSSRLSDPQSIENQLPIRGRARRMRVNTNNSNSRRHRRVGRRERRRVGNGSPLNDPLEPNVDIV
jgi:hypothetical protein